MDEHVNDVNAGKSEMEIGETDNQWPFLYQRL